MLPFLDETDELFNYWILRALLLVVLYLAWRSTYVREDRPSAQDAVLAIENNLRRLNTLPLRRLNTQHNVTTIILRSSSQQSNISNVTETEGLDLENDSIASSIDNITQSILTEASESATGLDLSDTEGYPSVVRPAVVVDTFHDAGPEEIIRQMDATDQDGGSRPSTITDNTAGTPSSSELRQRRRPPTAGNEPNAAALPERAGTASALETMTADSATGSDVKPIRIKLKYLNDDSKLVEGNLNEGIGEFKRRNFTLELAAQKLVRLVFNGHVLQPDTKTLAACGLFDNCVVHCLIHNQKSSLNGGDRAQDGGTVSGDNRFQIAAGDSANDGGNNENGNENADNREANGHPNESTRSRTRYGTYFIHIGTLAVTVLILYGWYCRFHYGHLFNMSSTIGLIATTTTFLIMMPTIILADSNTPN